MIRLAKITLVTGIFLLAFSACKKEEQPEEPVYGLSVISGNNQQGTVTIMLEKEIEFKVTDQFGEPVSGRGIYFEKADNILIGIDSLVTDSSGIALLNWMMGESTGTYTFSAFLLKDGFEDPDTRVELSAAANNYGYFKDKRDDREYKFVKIGEQFWMAENLDYGGRISGHLKPDHTDTIVEKYYYLDNFDLGVTYGGLYNWYEAMAGAPADEKLISTTRGICPEGWHLPSYDEWFDLMSYADNSPNKLKSTEGWDIRYDTIYVWDAINSEFTNEIDTILTYDFNGTDDYGFRALGTGYRGLKFNDQNQSYFWTEKLFSYYMTTREYSWDKKMTYIIGIYGPQPDIFDAGPSSKEGGYCVRCIMDK